MRGCDETAAWLPRQPANRKVTLLARLGRALEEGAPTAAAAAAAEVPGGGMGRLQTRPERVARCREAAAAARARLLKLEAEMGSSEGGVKARGEEAAAAVVVMAAPRSDAGSDAGSAEAEEEGVVPTGSAVATPHAAAVEAEVKEAQEEKEAQARGGGGGGAAARRRRDLDEVTFHASSDFSWDDLKERIEPLLQEQHRQRSEAQGRKKGAGGGAGGNSDGGGGGAAGGEGGGEAGAARTDAREQIDGWEAHFQRHAAGAGREGDRGRGFFKERHFVRPDALLNCGLRPVGWRKPS